MSPRLAVEALLLGLVVLCCWLGVLGMLRMPEPMQALHYLGVPACVGSPCLALAVFAATGNSSAAWKTLLIAVLLLFANAVVTHAVARAFRTRELGHWTPEPGDAFEYTPALLAARAQRGTASSGDLSAEASPGDHA